MVKMVRQTVSAEDVTDAHETASSQEPFRLESSQQKKCDIKGFFRRNTFVLVTVGAIATGRSPKCVCVCLQLLHQLVLFFNLTVTVHGSVIVH